MKRRLLYIVTKLELGGAQKHVLDLIRHADPSRYEVHLFSAREGVLWEEARSIPGLYAHPSKFLERPLHPVRDLLALAEMVRFIRERKIEIVHTHSSKAGILGRWAARLGGAKRVVHTVHGWSFNDHQRPWVRSLFAALERRAARFTDRIIVVSSSDERRGLARRIGSPSRYALIPYGIDPDVFGGRDATVSFRREWGVGADALVVGSIACFKAQKAPQDFLKLALRVKAEVPGVKFLIAGDGVLRPEIERMKAGLGLDDDVRLLGWCRDIPRFLRSIDVFVLTSRWEGLPISVLEAMASSRPVVVTDTGGVLDLVREGQNGRVVPVGDLSGMTQKVVDLLSDRQERCRLGEAGRDRLKDWPRVAEMARRVAGVYEEGWERSGGERAR